MGPWVYEGESSLSKIYKQKNYLQPSLHAQATESADSSEFAL